MQFSSHNNALDAPTCIHCPYVQYAPTQRRLITTKHKSLAFLSNITKIATAIELTTYLQIITITNKLLTPMLLFHIYMSIHEEDLQLVPISNK